MCMYMSMMYTITYICTCSNTDMYMYMSKMCNDTYICTCTYTGVIQTAYANGSSTRYLTDVLVSKGHSCSQKNFHNFRINDIFIFTIFI